MRRRLLDWVCLAIAIAGLASIGCAATVRSASAGATEAAVPAAARSAVDALEDPKMRERIAALLATPEMQRALRALSGGVAQGVVAEEGIDRAALDRLAASMTAAAMRAAAEQIPQAIAPAMRRAMTDELGVGLADALKSPEVTAAVSELTFAIARSAVKGSNAGLADLAAEKRESRDGAPLGAVAVSLPALFDVRTWLVVVAVGGALVFLLLVWLLFEWRAAHRVHEERPRHA